MIGSLADVSASSSSTCSGSTTLRKSDLANVVLAVAIIVVMTTICVIGTEISAHLQRVLTLGQVAILLAVRRRRLRPPRRPATRPRSSIDPELDWLSPFGVEYSGLLTGVLLAVFIYWGWESAVNLSEESKDSSRAPGLAGLASTVILLVTYIAVTVALIAYLGSTRSSSSTTTPASSAVAGNAVLGSDLGKLLVDRGDRLRDLLGADDDPARLAHLALDGGRRGAAEAVRAHPSALPHPGLRDDRRRRAGDALVRPRAG